MTRAAEVAVLAVAAFPLSTYLAGVVDAHVLGVAAYAGVLAAIDAALVAAVCLTFGAALARLGTLVAATAGVLAVDLVAGAALQLNTIFGYSPIIAGRFAGIGNVAFAVLGVCGLLTGALIVHALQDRRAALAAVAIVYLALVVVVGAPQLGGDVGGTLALVPTLALTWVLLSGRRPDPRLIGLALLGAVLALALFLAIDVARPPEQRTHFARLWLDIVEQGAEPLLDAVQRKARANLRVFSSTIYTLFVPPAVAALAWLLRSPRGRWERLAAAYPRLRAGLLGGILLGVLGFLVNDSGIVIPAMVLSYLLPMATVLHLSLDLEARV